jgi:hypothetical protein
MKKIIWQYVYILLVPALIGTFTASAGIALAADQARTQQTQTRIQEQEQIYGSQLMTPQERIEYRKRMRAARTAEEREKIRNEHHELMKERAREQGITLPDTPPQRGIGGGMGPGGRNR